MRSYLHEFDSRITQVVIHWPKYLRTLFIVITTFGDPRVIIALGFIIASVGLSYHSPELILTGALVWITLAVGALLKIAFGRIRPLTDYAAKMRIFTYSFPSGHAAGAIIAYGILGYAGVCLLPEMWGQLVNLVMIALVLAVGVSRVYLGAHFPSDVVAGWLLGATTLALVIIVIRPFV